MNLNGEKDFSHLKRFPGEVGNPFDILLHRLEAIERWPFWLFGGILLIPALLGGRFSWPGIFILWSFILLDWMLLRLLPAAGLSFGPARPSSLLLAILRIPFGLIPEPINWIFQTLGTVLVAYGFWIEPHRLEVTYQHLLTPKLPKGVSFSILHLGDLHIERLSRREKSLIQWVKKLNPTLILFSGDFLNLSYLEDPKAQKAAKDVVSHWQAPKGVFIVTGSPAVDFQETIPKILEGTTARWLKDEEVTIELPQAKFDIIGLTCSHRPHLDGHRLEKILSNDESRFRILLYHTPDLAPAAARLGLDLQVSGHTHGGQVRIPGYGALFSGSLYGKRFEGGRHQIGSMILYVTRGIGMEGAGAPRIRFFCPPEITFWNIEGTGSFKKEN